MNPTLEIVAILACLLVEGFFSGSEMAIVSADRLYLRSRAEQGHRGSRLALEYLDRPERLLGTCLLGTNLCVVTAATLTTHLMARWVGSHAALASTLILTPLVLLLAEMSPKSIYEHHAVRLAPVVVYPLRVASFLFTPAILVIQGASWLLFKIVRAPADVTHRPVSREEICLLLESDKEKDVAKEKLELIRKVFEFGDKVVREAMVPLIQVVALPAETTIRDAARSLVESGFSRIPVYEERVDQIVGVLFHRDLLFAADLDAPVRTCLRSVRYTPESKRIDALLGELRSERQRFAVVVDEYGGAVGIITVEDILEEIVGEIEDEFDDESVPIHRVGERQWIAEARVEREPLVAHLGLTLPDGDFETLAGFLLNRLGRIPAVGDPLTWQGWKFVVTKATDRSVLEVSIQRLFGGP